MKKSITAIVVFVFTLMSGASLADSESDGSNEGDVVNGVEDAVNDGATIHQMCWEGSNSGNQHDGLADEFTVTFESTGTSDYCEPNDDSDRPPKHCTHTNKEGMKHTDSASGC